MPASFSNFAAESLIRIKNCPSGAVIIKSPDLQGPTPQPRSSQRLMHIKCAAIAGKV
jgi:hypothetical protein